jgi:hypothetical protein
MHSKTYFMLTQIKIWHVGLVEQLLLRNLLSPIFTARRAVLRATLQPFGVSMGILRNQVGSCCQRWQNFCLTHEVKAKFTKKLPPISASFALTMSAKSWPVVD